MTDKSNSTEPVETPVVSYTVDAKAFQTALNTLADLPYKQVGDLLNTLRRATPVYGTDEESENAV